MAYDKVVDSSVLNAGLKTIADAIREKAGTSDSLAFPAAMAEAIAAIEAGGGSSSGITAGRFMFAETTNVSDRPAFEHGLGSRPIAVVVTRMPSSDTTTSMSVGEPSAVFAHYEMGEYNHNKASTSATNTSYTRTYLAVSAVKTAWDNPALTRSARVQSVTETSFNLYAQCLAGIEYLWIAFAEGSM